MKNSFKAILLAGVSAAAMIAAGSAMATTPTTVGTGCTTDQLAGGMTTVYTEAKNGNAVQHCINTYYVNNGGEAVTATNTTKPKLDGNGTQIIIDGHPIVTWHSLGDPAGNPVAQVHGTDGVAVGNGASVGSISATCSNGATGTVTNGIPKCPDVAATHTGSVYSCPNGGNLVGTVCKSQPLVIAHDVKDGTAIGAGASVQHDHSTALGAGAASTTDHQVVLGTKDDTIAAPGITSQLSKARQTGPLEVVTTDANGNLASDGGRIDATLSDHETRITNTETKNAEQDATLANHETRITNTETKNTEQDARLDNHETRITSNTTAINQTNNRLNVFTPTGETSTGSLEAWAAGVDQTNANQNIHLSNIDSHMAHLDGEISTLNKNMDKAYSGIAIAMAMESPQVDPGKRFGISVNWGEFEGNNAFAASAKFRFDNTWSGTAGVGTSTNGQVGARAGLQAQW